MTLTLRERRRAQLRDEILAATHQLMTERGYAAMSMDELATRVGVSKPTLYNQFPTKEDLVVEMALGLLEQTFAQLEAHGEASPLERLLRFLHASVRLQVAHNTSAMQLWLPEIVAILERHPRSREYLCRVDERLVNTVHAAIEAGEIDAKADVASIVRIFNALNISPSIARSSLTGEPDAELLADLVVAVFRRGLAPR